MKNIDIFLYASVLAERKRKIQPTAYKLLAHIVVETAD
ncbi:MAG: hypothetical protein IEMM0001_1283 [bacterium]|nr:MAG: hypothetical protein IEMM0001_1283 [bacterium]